MNDTDIIRRQLESRRPLIDFPIGQFFPSVGRASPRVGCCGRTIDVGWCRWIGIQLDVASKPAYTYEKQ